MKAGRRRLFCFCLYRPQRKGMSGLVPAEQVPPPSLPTLRVWPLPLTGPRVATPSRHTLPLWFPHAKCTFDYSFIHAFVQKRVDLGKLVSPQDALYGAAGVGV